MPIHFPLHGLLRSRPRLTGAVVLGCVIGPLMPHAWPWLTRVLSTWDIAVWVYLAAMSWMMMRADHHQVKRVAAKQDEKAPVILFVLCVAAVMSLLAIVSQLSELKDMSPDLRAIHYVLVVTTLLGSWFLVATLFCFHYAHMFYNDDGTLAPLEFPEGEENPNYWDFLYFSFTIAVAAQTSDVAVKTRLMRQVVLAQSVLSFFFNLVILGLSINIAAGLINT